MSDLRTAVVTGATGGIGLETARELARQGFHVVLLARSPAKADAARIEIEGDVGDASLDVVLADLSLQSEVRRAASELEDRLERLDVLVNNAGIQVRKREVTAEGHEVMLATNHLAPFLLTGLLVPLLRKSAPARIVNVASDAHRFAGRLRLDDIEATRGYGLLGMPRYGETKLMNILFTRELARRLDGSGVTANAVHPGAVATGLGAPPKLIAGISGRVLRSPAQGAATSVVVATDPALAGTTGGYFANAKRAEKKLTKQAKDDELARRLWALSEELTEFAWS